MTARRRRKRVEELLRESDDFKLCSGIFDILAESEDWTDVSRYAPEERVIVLVWHSHGLIENGGFYFLLGADFIGDPGFVYTAASYRSIGAETAYQCFRRALAFFPAGTPHKDLQARRDFYDKVPVALRDSIDQMFWDSVPEIRKKLADYIRSNDERLLLFLKRREPVDR